jgi:hypothetical protein
MDERRRFLTTVLKTMTDETPLEGSTADWVRNRLGHPKDA